MVRIRAIAPALVGFLVGSVFSGSFALAGTFGNPNPPGCQGEVSAEIAMGKTFHGAKCNSPLCACSAFQCTRVICVGLKGGKCVKVQKFTTYQQAVCPTKPQ